MNERGTTAPIERAAVAAEVHPLAAGGGSAPWRGLIASLALLGLLTAIKLLWAKHLGSAPSYLLYFAVILVGAWYGGVRVGLLMTALAAWLGHALFSGPTTAPLSTPSGLLRVISFGLEGAAITLLAAYAQRGWERAAVAARQAESASAKLRRVLSAVADAITVQDASGRLVYANAPAAELIGFASVDALLRATPEEILQRFEIFAADGTPLPWEELPGRYVLRGEPAPERLIRYRARARGDERWAMVSANPVQLAGAAEPFAVNVFRDVTAQQQHAEELRLGREWFETALRSIGDAVIATDAAGRVTFLNPQAEALTRYRADASERRPLAEVFRVLSEDERTPVEDPVARALREGRVVGLGNHTLLIARDGTEYAIEDSVAPIRAPNGELVGTVLVFRDVSIKREQERRRAFIASATAELASSLDYAATLRTLARLAVPSIADFCVVEICEHGAWHRLAIEHADPAQLERLLELERSASGDTDRSSLRSAVWRTGEPVLVPDASSDAEASAQLAPLVAIGLGSFLGVPLHAHGEPLGAISLARGGGKRSYQPEDLAQAVELADRAGLAVSNARLFSRAEAARSEAEQANRAKDEFLALLGHELRNPLAPIVTALQLMKLRAADVFEKERTIVERQVRHMVTLVDDLLDVSRITRGKVELQHEPVELAATVHKALELAAPLIEQRQHSVDVEVGSTLRVRGDAVRLAQVFSNLLTNAAKYTPPRGHISIAARAHGDQVTLRVRDDGAGIEPELLPRVFDLFVQGGQPLDRSQGGLGLGLTIVRSVVELHGGTVVARSEGRGKGSEFSVTLPLLTGAAASVRPVDPRAAASAAGGGNGAKILIVDDNQDALALLSEALELVGYETHGAEDAASALATAQVVKPQLALLDIGLPVMNGYELARRLRALPGLATIKLAALTGYGQPADKERATAAGFDEHLVKPISIERVQDVVSRLLRAS